MKKSDTHVLWNLLRNVLKKSVFLYTIVNTHVMCTGDENRTVVIEGK